MLRKLMLAACLLATFHTSAAGETPFIYGIGNRSCESWLMDRENPTIERAYQNFMQGFVSGYGVAYQDASRLGRVLPIPDTDTMTVAVTNYCHDHPLEMFAIAVGKLLLMLHDSAQQKTR